MARPLTGEERYRQMRVKVNLRHARNLRLYLADQIDILPDDGERQAIIEELDRAYAAGRSALSDPRAPETK